jgi:hypothetical protein
MAAARWPGVGCAGSSNRIRVIDKDAPETGTGPALSLTPSTKKHAYAVRFSLDDGWYACCDRSDAVRPGGAAIRGAFSPSSAPDPDMASLDAVSS